MIEVVDRPDGTRKVSISFPEDEVVIRRLPDDRKAFYEDYVSRSKTKPEFEKQVDLNLIMKKFDKTGIIDPLLYRDMDYGDFSQGNDFAAMSMRVKDALNQFSNLPAEIRNHFKNDPALLIDFINDPSNDEEAIQMGLKVRPAEAPAAPVPVAPVPSVPAAPDKPVR